MVLNVIGCIYLGGVLFCGGAIGAIGAIVVLVKKFFQSVHCL